MPLKAVFFDLVGTLVEPREPIGSQYAAVARRHGAEADPGRLEAAFAREMAVTPAVQAWGLPREAAEAAERDWWRRLVERVFGTIGPAAVLAPGRFGPFFDDLYRHFTTADAWRLHADALPALAALKDGGFVTGLITNYDSRIHRLVVSLGLAARLDSITIPATAGARKPAPRIFAHALAGHGLDADDSGYVGDSLADDYLGAKGAGMRAVLLDRDGGHPGLAGVPRAATLDEAIRLLQGR